MKVYIVITEEYDIGISDFKRKGVEVFKDPAKAIITIAVISLLKY